MFTINAAAFAVMFVAIVLYAVKVSIDSGKNIMAYFVCFLTVIAMLNLGYAAMQIKKDATINTAARVCAATIQAEPNWVDMSLPQMNAMANASVPSIIEDEEDQAAVAASCYSMVKDVADAVVTSPSPAEADNGPSGTDS